MMAMEQPLESEVVEAHRRVMRQLGAALFPDWSAGAGTRTARWSNRIVGLGAGIGTRFVLATVATGLGRTYAEAFARSQDEKVRHAWVEVLLFRESIRPPYWLLGVVTSLPAGAAVAIFQPFREFNLDTAAAALFAASVPSFLGSVVLLQARTAFGTIESDLDRVWEILGRRGRSPAAPIRLLGRATIALFVLAAASLGGSFALSDRLMG
jgi:hypothetical protein